MSAPAGEVVRVLYKKGGVRLKPGRRYVIQMPPEVFRVRLTGLHFESNKCFLLPSGIRGMQALASLYEKTPGLALLITGHTDRQWTAEANLQLSKERAEAMAAFLRNDVEAWLAHYGDSVDPKKRWGTLEDQHMLSALGDVSGPFYDPSQVDGQPGPNTQRAASAFQRWSNQTRGTSLAVDGDVGSRTRRALVAAYMDQPKSTLPDDALLQTHGCGYYHNAVPNPPDTAVAANRRAEVFFFKG
ncbi:MAG TPA: OmpA family protein, partial [Myxococcales bacterium]|nr:OmpA family protein [Myxococcales bacterium]